MNYIKKCIPGFLKRKIKNKLGYIDADKINSVIEDIAQRKAAAMVNANNCRLAGKIAVVTGGYGFIGKSITKRLCNEGAVVIVFGRNKDKMNDFISEENNPQIVPCIVDVTDYSSLEQAFKKVMTDYGKIDILVNCAGGSARELSNDIREQEPEIINKIINLNLTSAILCCKYAAQYMCEQGFGKIINISSTVGVGGKAGYSEYAAAKAGINGFTRSLALELGKNHITVNCVIPGIVEREKITPQKTQRISKTNAMQSVGIDNDISYAVSFLASDEANFITGQNIIVDGGRSLGLKGD